MGKVRIKMNAIYDHFPDHHPVDGLSYIDCYSDHKMSEAVKGDKTIAMLFEPRSMLGEAYDFVEAHSDYFRLIFTHDSKLLKLPQSRFLNWAYVWHTSDSEKTKSISLITSPKDWCPLHKARLELARYFEPTPFVDVFRGGWNEGEKNYSPQEYLEHYTHSIVIENDIDEFWYTEKILNCFSNKVVPIYVGATRIGEIFNADGIIQVDDWRDIPKIVEDLDTVEDYVGRLEAINDNFERVKPYTVGWQERFFKDYGDILEALQDE